MNCPKCGAASKPGSKFCMICGAPLTAGAAGPSGGAQTYAPPPAGYTNTVVVSHDAVPYQNRPLSPWAYFGLSILYVIPLIGLIFLIVNSFNNDNINRRNHARSYFCGLLIAVILALIGLAISLILGVSLYSLFR